MSNRVPRQHPTTPVPDQPVGLAAALAEADATEANTAERSALDRRRGPGIRRTDARRAAEDGHMNEEQLDFIRAVDEYRRLNDRPFPTCTELLDILLYLGYRRVAPIGEYSLIKPRQGVRRGGPGDEPSEDGFDAESSEE
jgi:hypothetical protein